jgi:hypothetical protein
MALIGGVWGQAFLDPNAGVCCHEPLELPVEEIGLGAEGAGREGDDGAGPRRLSASCRERARDQTKPDPRAGSVPHGDRQTRAVVACESIRNSECLRSTYNSAAAAASSEYVSFVAFGEIR